MEEQSTPLYLTANHRTTISTMNPDVWLRAGVDWASLFAVDYRGVSANPYVGSASGGESWKCSRVQVRLWP